MVEELLLKGRRNATKGATLATILKTDLRNVLYMIEQERRAGAPICADMKTGYYLPENNEELAAYIKALHGRGCEIQKTYRLMKEAYNKRIEAEKPAGEKETNEEINN